MDLRTGAADLGQILLLDGRQGAGSGDGDTARHVVVTADPGHVVVGAQARGQLEDTAGDISVRLVAVGDRDDAGAANVDARHVLAARLVVRVAARQGQGAGPGTGV